MNFQFFLGIISSYDFTKICSECGIEMFYKTMSEKNRSEREKRICKKCASMKFNGMRGKHLTEKQKERLSGKNNPMYGKHHSNETKQKIRGKLLGVNNPFYGKKHTDSVLKLNVELNSGKNASWYGKHHSDETKLKQRISRLKWVESIGGRGIHGKYYNKIACKYFDELSKRNGWNLQHALNGGEVILYGYSVDAYDKNKNIVVEYDEPRHYDCFGNLKKKDIDRMVSIQENIKCEFWRYDEKRNVIKRYD